MIQNLEKGIKKRIFKKNKKKKMEKTKVSFGGVGVGLLLNSMKP